MPKKKGGTGCMVCGGSGKVPAGFNDATVGSYENSRRTKPCPKKCFEKTDKVQGLDTRSLLKLNPTADK